MQQYKQITDQQKIKFLDAIIRENHELQESFIRFFEAEKHVTKALPFEKFLKIVLNTKADFKKRFEDVDLENPDWEHYTPSHNGYMERWEQAMEASEQEFERIFDQFKSKATDLVISQNIDELTAMLIGLYLAATNAEIYDPWHTFDTVNDHLKDEHQATIIFITEKIKRAAIANHSIIYSTGLFFQYYSESDMGDKPGVAVFEDYLMTLAGKSTHPEQVLAQLDQSTIARKEMPRLTLFLTGMTEEHTDWLRLAQANTLGKLC